MIPQMIEDMIVREETHVFGGRSPSGGVMLVGVFWLANGYAVSGESDYAEEGQFEPGRARLQARERAKEKIRALEAYVRCQLRS
jgi:Phage protein (N4 Gp49/phage Sf6 gene 66) family